ncbi:MAG: protein translocase subunit SecDF [Bacteroidota bacterium]|jgi:SecD/SecF fusion protein
MQNKGAIRFFAIVLALACIFQLSFTWVTSRVEKSAKEYAENRLAGLKKSADKAAQANPDSVLAFQEKRYLDSVSSQPVYNILLKKFTYRECKEKEINLGLDLKGGMNVIMEIAESDIIRSMSNNNPDPNFNKAIENATKAQKKSQQDFITLFYDEYKKIDPNIRLATLFNTLELKDRIKYESTNDEVLAVLRKEAADAIDRSFNILRTRIDKFGVTQPNIQKLGNSGRILIELPGVKDKERVRKLLQGTANLEFWETYDNKEIQPALVEVNKRLAAINKGGASDSTAAKDSTATAAKADSANTKTAAKDTASEQNKGASLDLNKAAAKKNPKDSLSAKAKETNPLFDLMSPSVVRKDNGYYPTDGPVVGIAAIKDTATISGMLRKPAIRAMLPRNLRLLWTVKPFDKDEKFLQLVAIKITSRDGHAPLEGNVITDANGDFEQGSSKAEVSMSMNAEGAQTWKRLTGENIGKSIAIVLDDYVYSFPTVQSEIGGGRSSISGNFSINEAKDLANILKAGKLPARARIVQEDIVGPSLGKEAISAGLLSFLIALILVLVYMGFYYSKAGWVADLALFANVFFIMGILASLGAVLTLPGIAGIVLTIGLSVDANILIFERVREELAEGNSLKSAIRGGFKNAMSSIIDSNVTTLILGIILYVFGTGPIQGFATTLIIGILTSLFSAIFISRLIFEYMLDKNQEIAFAIPFTANAYKNININFVAKRKLYYIISGVIILAGVVAFVQKGLNLGVDFKGGRSYVIRFDKDVTPQEARDILASSLGQAPDAKTYGNNNQLKITTAFKIEEQGEETDNVVEKIIIDGLKKLPNVKQVEIMSSSKVGENISDDIKSSAVWAILISCLLMFIYIFIRFRKWQFGLGAVAALLHDVLVVLAVFSIFNGVLPFSLEINQDFIAAILTVMGYSMTDTVVVFDRIREFLALNKKKDLLNRETPAVINYALNSTLSRTLNTSLTIFFVLLAIFIFGGEVIRGFSFALLVGIVIGTYSSICIATPIVIDFDKRNREE